MLLHKGLNIKIGSKNRPIQIQKSPKPDPVQSSVNSHPYESMNNFFNTLLMSMGSYIPRLSKGWVDNAIGNTPPTLYPDTRTFDHKTNQNSHWRPETREVPQQKENYGRTGKRDTKG